MTSRVLPVGTKSRRTEPFLAGARGGTYTVEGNISPDSCLSSTGLGRGEDGGVGLFLPFFGGRVVQEAPRSSDGRDAAGDLRDLGEQMLFNHRTGVKTTALSISVSSENQLPVR